MKTFDLTHDTFGSLQRRIITLQHKLESRTPIHINLNIKANSASIKSIINYVSAAANEGLKQNLLGNDINLEFLLLTIRSYTHKLIEAVAPNKHGNKNLHEIVTSNENLVS